MVYEASIMKKKSFVTSSEPSIATYNFIDIAEGTGVIEYCGTAVCTSDTTYSYILTTNKNYYSARGGYANLNGFSETFSVTFNTQKRVKGKVVLAVPVWVYAQTETRTGYITAVLKKNATEIGASIQSESFAAGNQTPYKTTHLVVVWDITTQVDFAKGDTLNVTITGAASGGSGSTTDCIGFSPIGGQATGFDTNFSANPGRLSLYVPTILDL